MKMRQRTRNNWLGVRKEQKVLRQLWDKKEEEGGRRAGCREEQPWFLYPETRNNLPPPPQPPRLYSFPPSLPSISLPLGSPSASYHGNRRRGRKKKKQREMRSVPKEELSQLKISKFLLRRGADLLHRFRARLCWLNQSLFIPNQRLQRSSLKQQIKSASPSKTYCCLWKTIGMIIQRGEAGYWSPN